MKERLFDWEDANDAALDFMSRKIEGYNQTIDNPNSLQLDRLMSEGALIMIELDIWEYIGEIAKTKSEATILEQYEKLVLVMNGVYHWPHNN